MTLTNITPKFNRQGVPAKVLIGRLSKRGGTEQVLTMDDVAREIARGSNPLARSSQKVKEFLQVVADGLFAADEFHACPGPPIPTTFPCVAGKDESIATCTDAGTNAHTRFYLVSDIADFLAGGTDSVVCTVTFAAAAKTGTFLYGSSRTLPAAIKLYLVADPTPDPSLAGVELVFCGSPA